jgi:hypothetical protein
MVLAENQKPHRLWQGLRKIPLGSTALSLSILCRNGSFTCDGGHWTLARMLHFRMHCERLTKPRNDLCWRDQRRVRPGHSSTAAIAHRTDGEVIRAVTDN